MISLLNRKPESFDTVCRWLSNSSINRWLTSEWRNRVVNSTTIAIALRNPRNRMFLILYGERPCGLVCLAEIDAPDRTAMVWYLLGDTSLSGRGIVSQAVRELVQIAFGEMGLNSLYAWVMQDNIDSQRVLERAGFTRAGRIRRAAFSAGRLVDRIYFDIVSTQPGDNKCLDKRVDGSIR